MNWSDEYHLPHDDGPPPDEEIAWRELGPFLLGALLLWASVALVVIVSIRIADRLSPAAPATTPTCQMEESP